MREVGESHPGGPAALSVAPSGDALAFVVRRADPERNLYCVALVVLPLQDKARPVVLDTSDTLLRDETPWMGLSDLQSGRPLLNRPLWSADGRFLFYLKAVDGVAQVWRVARDGTDARAMTHTPISVVSFALAADGRTLFYTSRAGLVAARAALAAEGRRGWVYDERFWTIQSAHPYPAAQAPIMQAVDLATGAVRDVGSGEQKAVEERAQVDAGLAARSADGRFTALPGPAVSGSYFSPTRITVREGDQPLDCPDPVCGDRSWQIWIHERSLFVLRDRLGDQGGVMELQRWSRGDRAPRTLWRGADLLHGCARHAAMLYCLREAAAIAPEIVRIDLHHGALTRLLALNPELAPERLGRPTRLTWRDAMGVAGFGDFVLPRSHRAGERHPLIIVQYESRGFLRGGTGDEYPIHVFADRGYAVLSLHAPRRAVAEAAIGQPTLETNQRVMFQGHFMRRHFFASLEAGVDAAIATGTIDQTRIGLTGMSDGELTACFALIHHQRYAAAALSGGCQEPEMAAAVGPVWVKLYRLFGVPDSTDHDEGYWKDISLIRNVDRIRLPILIQTADAELRISTGILAAFRKAGRPMEMIVYPGEYHNKWQPAHRQAVYDANLLWFDFWLRGIEHPGEEERYARWRALKGEALAAGSARSSQ